MYNLYVQKNNGKYDVKYANSLVIRKLLEDFVFYVPSYYLY